jgi:hypothetical protein
VSGPLYIPRIDCLACHGTGAVTVPTRRTVRDDLGRQDVAWVLADTDCAACGGRGRVPDPDPMAWESDGDPRHIAALDALDTPKAAAFKAELEELAKEAP